GRGGRALALALRLAAGLRAARRTLLVAAAAPTAGALRGGRQREGRRRGDHGGIGLDLVDPEAQDAVGDLEAVVEIVEQVAVLREAEEAVIRLGALLDLVGELAQPPRALLLELAGTLDAPTRF